MILRLSLTLVLILISLHPAAAGPTLDVAVDFTDLPRHLLHSRLEIPADGGELVLWYPKWVPGTHAPSGPIANLAGLRITTSDGQAVRWQRDDEEPYRFICTPPETTRYVVVELDYICNQPTVNSVGADVQGGPLVGYLNWNTCLMYPEGHEDDEINVRLRLKVPEKWSYATALPVSKERDGWIHFEDATLRRVLDSPLIGGEHLRSYELQSDNLPPASLHLTSESPSAIELPEDLVEKYRRVVQEAGSLFGRAPYKRYDFLVTCSDEIGYMGLEHLASSLNGVGQRDLLEEDKRRGWVAELLPHEYAHSWCGKFRRPAGMLTNNFHQPKRTELLWVYEGLTQHLGQVLTVRSGLHSKEEYLDQLAMTVSGLRSHKGRRWRPLEDTAVASHQLRARSTFWNNLRRDQDYYSEGALYWLEADAIIREETDGRKSLDDFCQSFFGLESEAEIVPYDRGDVCSALEAVAPYDWQGFFERRVYSSQDELPLEAIARCGYRLEYSVEPSGYHRKREQRGYVDLSDSIGLVVNDDGKIRAVVPDSASDEAGLGPGMEVAGVNDFKFSVQRLRDAVADSVTRREVQLLLLEGDRFRTVAVAYAGGHRYLHIVRDESKPDLLSDILQPRVAGRRRFNLRALWP